ncbi:peptide deformylase [Aequorivita viscosa]|uniref:Peptide deformylase n=1 Tax=Aequorivita viscosa TaxID=797419 RepID=A0A1M6LDQ2_9FLAO|nr:peptide deformylase [Aequorivita viscosa]SDW00072.1 peptide deformylase [Aequorivita viscosa]SHJ69287.1 peptide deformylase [Aequorivita viscosa]
MVLPIVAYGDPVLRKETEAITKDFPKLDELIENMFETMYAARGIGLAAPQIGMAVRLFIVDATIFEDDEDLTEEEQKFASTFKKVFINPEIIEESGDEWAFNEGCLSIPDVREDVFRQPEITIVYEDENFKKHKETLSGIVARIVQHEYDHIEGVLFTDKLSPLKKRLIKSKLTNISKGKIDVDYRMRFPNAKKKR